jgi:hypothetical protein
LSVIYGPDNGWYYRVTGSKIERAFPSTGRTWEEVAPGTSAYTAIQAMLKSLGKRGRTVSAKDWKKLLKKMAKMAKAAESSAPAFQPSFYSPPSTTPRQQAAPRQRDGGGRSSNVPALVGVGVAGFASLVYILYLASRP